MNWPIFVSDIAFALAAVLVIIIGLSTLKAVKHLGIGKSFWIPVSASGVLFLVGSLFTILNAVAVELNLSPMTWTDQLVHFSWVFALCFLMVSIFSYSRKVKTEARTVYYEVDSEMQPQLKPEPPKAEKKKKKKLLAKPPSLEAEKDIPSCPHYFGYLSKIPEGASVPQECLTCQRMLECRNQSILARSMHEA